VIFLRISFALVETVETDVFTNNKNDSYLFRSLTSSSVGRTNNATTPYATGTVTSITNPLSISINATARGLDCLTSKTNVSGTYATLVYGVISDAIVSSAAQTVTYETNFCTYDGAYSVSGDYRYSSCSLIMTASKAQSSFANMIYNAGNTVTSFHVEFDFSFSCSTSTCADGFGFIFGPYSFLSTSLNKYNAFETGYPSNGNTIAFQFSEYNYYMYLTGTDGSKQIIYDVILTSLSTSLQHITIDYSINKVMTMKSSLSGSVIATATSTINLGTANAFLLGARTGAITASHTFKNFKLQYTSTPPTSAPSLSPISKPTLFPTLIPKSAPTLTPISKPTTCPTSIPTSAPTLSPISKPTTCPTSIPTSAPTLPPISKPSMCPTSIPTSATTLSPISKPTTCPTSIPTSNPIFNPTSFPNLNPTLSPTSNPTLYSNSNPTLLLISDPTLNPTSIASSAFPTYVPTLYPTSVPSSASSTFNTLPITISYNTTFCAYDGAYSVNGDYQYSSCSLVMTASKAQSSFANIIFYAENTVSSFHVEFDFSFSCSSSRCADGFGFIFGPQIFLSTSLNQLIAYDNYYNFNENTIAFQFSEYNKFMCLSGTDGSKQTIYNSKSTSSSNALQHITIDYSINKVMTMTSSLSGTLTATSTINLGNTNAFLLGARTGAITASHTFKNFKLQYTSTPPTSAPTLSPFSIPTEYPTLIPTSAPTSSPISIPTEYPTLIPTSSPISIPTEYPTLIPTSAPTLSPISIPTEYPTLIPTSAPTLSPISMPTAYPTLSPTSETSSNPTIIPTVKPTNPTSQSSSRPTCQPSGYPSGAPSLMPTSSPTCFTNRTCPLNTYIQMSGNCADCIACSFPYATNVENSRTCSAVNLNISNFWLIIILGTLGFMFICTLISAKNDFRKAFQVTLFPVIDVNSDLIYILTTPFYNVTLFYFAVIFYLLSNFIFFYQIYEEFKHPFKYEDIWWLNGRTVTRNVTYEKEDGTAKQYEISGYQPYKNDNLYLKWFGSSPFPVGGFGCVMFIVVWIIAFVHQLLHIIFYIFRFITHFSLWFIFGMFLYQIKAFAVVDVAKSWQLYSPLIYTHEEIDKKIDIKFINISVYSELFLEAIGQLILQSINNTLNNTWSIVSIISTFSSTALIFDNVVRWYYFKILENYDLEDIPRDYFWNECVPDADITNRNSTFIYTNPTSTSTSI
jgi:hypothetical protein